MTQNKNASYFPIMYCVAIHCYLTYCGKAIFTTLVHILGNTNLN
jgi:hypothetical protein